MSKTCLFIGRFQPYHKGHHLVVQGMVKVCDRVVIGIGSAKESHTEKNPFTVEERKDMIQHALQEDNMIPQYNIDFVEIPDRESDKEWTEECLEIAHDPSVVWTGNPDTERCFQERFIDVQNIKEVPGISGTEIRERLKNEGDWQSMVPSPVARHMKKIDAVERMKNIK